jgi:hypothetical protein
MKHKVVSISPSGPVVLCPKLGKVIGIFSSSGFICRCGKHTSDNDGTR